MNTCTRNRSGLERGAVMVELIFLVIFTLVLIFVSYEFSAVVRSRAQLAALSRETAKAGFQFCHLVVSDTDMELCVQQTLSNILPSASYVRKDFEVALSVYSTTSGAHRSALCSATVTAGVASAPACPGTFATGYSATGAGGTVNVTAGVTGNLLTAQDLIFIGEVRGVFTGSQRALVGWFTTSDKTLVEKTIL